MSTVLLTGVTGQVGSQLATFLQKQGWQVLYLIRADDDHQALERLQTALPELRTGDIALAGDVVKPLAGLGPSQLESWRGKIDKIIHGAASISFDEKAAEETWAINVEGTRRMLELAQALAVPEFHFLSTVYIAGDAGRFHEEDRDIGQNPRNPYERSKLAAEKLVVNSGICHNILRMSIVIGDSQTGYTPAFTGYYQFLKGFWQLRQFLSEQWSKDEEQLRPLGIHFNGQENLQLPLSIDCSPTSTLNLVTSDWLSEMLVKLISRPATNQTFNLVHPNPPRVEWAIKTSLEILGINGIRFREPNISADYPTLRTLQRGAERNLRKFLPYITHEPQLENPNLRGVEGYHPPPTIDRPLLKRMLAYAKTVGFGGRILV